MAAALLVPLMLLAAADVRPGPAGARRQQVACHAGIDSLIRIPDAGAAITGGRDLWIHRPAGPDRASLPVLYLLHGIPGSALAEAAGPLGARFDEIICRTHRPFVVAAPDGNAGGDSEWGDAADGSFTLESMVTTRVIDAVEGGRRRPRQLRAIGGFSMGGFGATAIALRHPDLYGQVLSFGGYFRIDDPDHTFGADSDAHDPGRLLGAAGGLRLFLVEGADDHEALQLGSIHGEADRFAAQLRPLGVDVETDHPPGGHDPATWDAALPAAVSFLDAGWAARAGGADRPARTEHQQGARQRIR
ncbi:MAG: alpha/beta hydrolase-fold protein [Actinomycetota bacterium]|nr:alpha/beta hydrolase-fold protein [Actinomycetota bacterium]